MRLFKDTEYGDIVTESVLKAEFNALRSENPTEYNYSFDEYVNNCISKNGFLTEI